MLLSLWVKCSTRSRILDDLGSKLINTKQIANIDYLIHYFWIAEFNAVGKVNNFSLGYRSNSV